MFYATHRTDYVITCEQTYAIASYIGSLLTSKRTRPPTASALDPLGVLGGHITAAVPWATKRQLVTSFPTTCHKFPVRGQTKCLYLCELWSVVEGILIIVK